MSDSFKRFIIEHDRAEELMEQEVLAIHKTLALNLLKGVVLKTPVDLGRARGNWNVSIDIPDPTVTDERNDKVGGATISKGEVAILTPKDLRVIWVTNNVEYIVPLDNGHSKNAPAGMTRPTLAELGLT